MNQQFENSLGHNGKTLMPSQHSLRSFFQIQETCIGIHVKNGTDHFCVVFCDDKGREKAVERADLIQRSVNTLPQLVEALEKIVPLIDSEIARLDIARKDPLVKPWIESLEQAKSALAAAKGGQAL